MSDVGRGLGSCLATVALLGCQFRIGGVKPPEHQSPDDLALRAVDLATVRPGDLARALDFASSLGPDMVPLVGQISVGGPDAIPSTVDLSHEGTLDWAHCGYMNVPGVDDHRASGANSIAIGTTGGIINANSPYTPTFSWSDGTPTVSASSQAGIYVTGIGHGLTVTVPASTTPHTLRVYLDVYQSTAQLSAHLSDSSAPDFVGTMIHGDDPGTYARFTILFHAASPGQTLTVGWTMTADNGGSIDLMAATLY
jgi:hypothetical protein